MAEDFDLHEIAASTYLLARKASLLAAGESIDNVPDWSGLSYELQIPWVRLAKTAPALLEKLEGMPFQQVAFEIYCESIPEVNRDAAHYAFFVAGSESFRLAWEAIARHLLMVNDCEGLSGVQASEQMWVSWFSKKLDKILTPEGVH